MWGLYSTHPDALSLFPLPKHPPLNPWRTMFEVSKLQTRDVLRLGASPCAGVLSFLKNLYSLYLCRNSTANQSRQRRTRYWLKRLYPRTRLQTSGVALHPIVLLAIYLQVGLSSIWFFRSFLHSIQKIKVLFYEISFTWKFNNIKS